MTAIIFDRAVLVRSLKAVAAGDREALHDVYRRTSAKLFSVCLRILNDRSEAEDVLQEVYLTVWRKAAMFDETRASPVTWLTTIARNRAIEKVRGAGGRVMLPIDAAGDPRDERPDAAATLEASQEARRLEACLEELEPRHAAAVRTAFFGAVTYEALAEREGLPLGTLKGWIRRSLLKLRDCLSI